MIYSPANTSIRVSYRVSSAKAESVAAIAAPLISYIDHDVS